MFTILQLAIVLSIPLGLLAVAMGRIMARKPIRIRDIAMTAQFAAIPAVLLLSMRQLVPWWAAIGSILLIALGSFIQSTNTD